MAEDLRRGRGRLRRRRHRRAVRRSAAQGVRRATTAPMSVLSPLFLLLGTAAAVPLLIHLLRRRVGNRVEFPAVRYLLRAEQENRRTLRLRNMLLMLLRVAAILLLSIAAARPIGRMIGVGHAPAAVVIVLDNTTSTGVVVGGRSMVDRFKSAATTMAAATTPADRVWL